VDGGESNPGKLHDRLTKGSVWVRPQTGQDGVAEYHCGVEKVAAWAGELPSMADAGGKVRAAGNSFSFKAAGRPVRVVAYHLPVA
jgi:hypothetical protein